MIESQVKELTRGPSSIPPSLLTEGRCLPFFLTLWLSTVSHIFPSVIFCLWYCGIMVCTIIPFIYNAFEHYHLSFIEGVVSNCMRKSPGLFSFLLCPSPSLARMGITNWCPLLFFLSILWLCRWLEGTLFCRSFRTWNLVLPRNIPFSRSYCLSLIAFLLYPWLYLLHSISASAYNRPLLNPCLSYLVFLGEVHIHFSDAKLGCTVAFQVPVCSPYSF